MFIRSVLYMQVYFRFFQVLYTCSQHCNFCLHSFIIIPLFLQFFSIDVMVLSHSLNFLSRLWIIVLIFFTTFISCFTSSSVSFPVKFCFGVLLLGMRSSYCLYKLLRSSLPSLYLWLFTWCSFYVSFRVFSSINQCLNLSVCIGTFWVAYKYTRAVDFIKSAVKASQLILMYFLLLFVVSTCLSLS